MENLKKISVYFKPIKWFVVGSVLLTLLSSSVSLVAPWMNRLIINSAADFFSGKIGHPQALENIYLATFYMIILNLASSGINVLQQYNGSNLWYKSRVILQNKFLEHISYLSIDFFENEKAGALINKYSRGVNKSLNFLQTIVNFTGMNIMTGIFAFIVLFLVNPTIGLVLLFFIVLNLFATRRMANKVNPIHKILNKWDDKVGEKVFSLISGIHTVRSFAVEEQHLKDFAYAQEKHFDVSRTIRKIRTQHFPFRFTIFGVGRAIITMMIGVQSLEGKMSLGDIALYFQYMSMISTPLFDFNRVIDEAQDTNRSLDEIIKVLETVPEIQDKENAIDLKKAKGNITFDKISFYYKKKEKKVINNISLVIKAGQSIALVGPSGMGKTTITKLLSRLYDVNKGSITIDGIDIRDVTQKSLRQNIGVVMQDIMLFNDTIKNNIKYGTPRSKGMDVINAAKAANIHDFIMGLPKGYNTIVGERGIKLSGGEKQRVAIARAVLKNAPILILDEATSHLDSESERLVQEALWKLIEGRTTIIIAHRLATVMKADKILVLDKGKIVEEGNHFELIKKDGLYAKLFKIQSGAMLLTDKEVKVGE